MPQPPTAPPSSIETIARGVLVRGSTVLMCQNLKHGYFYLPGGHVDPGETAADALAREFVEECGLEVEARHCLLVLESLFTQGGKARQEITVLFHVEHQGADEALAGLQSLEDHIGFEWVELAAVVDSDIRPGAHKAWLLEAPPLDSPTRWVSSVE